MSDEQKTLLPNSRATIEEAAAAFAKKRWPDDRFARRKFIAGAVFALDEALGFGGAEQPEDSVQNEWAR